MTKTRLVTAILGCGLLLGGVAAVQSGCQSSTPSGGEALVAPGMMAQQAAPARGAAEIWSSTCIRCHNSRSPGTYSDTEWDVAMLHMRIQANLTAEDSRTILEFLQASN